MRFQGLSGVGSWGQHLRRAESGPRAFGVPGIIFGPDVRRSLQDAVSHSGACHLRTSHDCDEVGESLEVPSALRCPNPRRPPSMSVPRLPPSRWQVTPTCPGHAPRRPPHLQCPPSASPRQPLPRSRQHGHPRPPTALLQASPSGLQGASEPSVGQGGRV